MSGIQILLALGLVYILSVTSATPVGAWWKKMEDDEILEVAGHSRLARSNPNGKPVDGQEQEGVKECFKADRLSKIEWIRINYNGKYINVGMRDCKVVNQTACSKTCGKGIMIETYQCDYFDQDSVNKKTYKSLTFDCEVICCCKPSPGNGGLPPNEVRCCDLPCGGEPLMDDDGDAGGEGGDENFE